MRLHKFHFDPEPHDDGQALLRLASGDEPFVASPVHGLQHQIDALAQGAAEVGLYPGWIRIMFPLAASGAMWLAIGSVVRLLV